MADFFIKTLGITLNKAELPLQGKEENKCLKKVFLVNQQTN